jgi:hypothetical protein
MELAIFHGLIFVHVITESAAALAFWVPVLGRKGGVNHRRWGRIFTWCVLLTGSFAIAMSLLTLYDPMGVHPHLVGRFDEPFVRGIFGWLMLHNGILTVNLGWYGWLCVTNRRDLAANRTALNVGLQYLVLLAAAVCAWEGALIGQPLMIGLSIVGLATGVTNLLFIYARNPSPVQWMKEHLKALVGAGISVYTAFLAFGSIRLAPSLALHPALWSIPLCVGLSLIIYHRIRIDMKAGLSIWPQLGRRTARASDPPSR